MNLINAVQNYTNELDAVMKQRIEKLLEAVDPERFDKNSSLSLLDQYEEALSVNKKGYSIHYKRDVMETMNTENYALKRHEDKQGVFHDMIEVEFSAREDVVT